MGKPDPQQPSKVLGHDSMKALLEAAGWTPGRGGKHVTKMQMSGRRPITLPKHQGHDYGPGLRSRILQEAGLKPAGDNDDDTGSDDGDEE